MPTTSAPRTGLTGTTVYEALRVVVIGAPFAANDIIVGLATPDAE